MYEGGAGCSPRPSPNITYSPIRELTYIFRTRSILVGGLVGIISCEGTSEITIAISAHISAS